MNHPPMPPVLSPPPRTHLRNALAACLLGCTTTFAADYPLAEARECRPRNGLPNFFAKATGTGEVRVAYLGGSITAAPGWRPKTLDAFREVFPTARFSEINAAIGGTGSDLGVFRLRHDVLDHHPDLLFVEFAVNDGGAAPERIQKAMEGIVRQTWKADPATDICFVYTLAEGQLADLQAGNFQRSASAMEAVADHYGIPSIHFGVEVARLVAAGELIFKAAKAPDFSPIDRPMLFSEDGVHPLVETGHELYRAAVVRSLPALRASSGTPRPRDPGHPLLPDNWEHARMIPLSPALLEGSWEKLDPAKSRIGHDKFERLGAVWKAAEPGATLRFAFRGSMASVYDLLGPDGGLVGIRVDDLPERIVPRIDGYCTYPRLARLDLGEMSNGLHRVTATLKAEAPDKANILFEKNRPDLKQHPEKYRDNVWHAGALLLLGELVASPDPTVTSAR